jgi:hypothetical protein
MTSDPRKQQRKEWVHLHGRLRKALKQFGEEDDGTKRKDYFLLDENLGLWQHRIETSNLEMVRPVCGQVAAEIAARVFELGNLDCGDQPRSR